jgi:hypothetical protein
MQKGIFVLLMLCISLNSVAQKNQQPLYTADNGVLLENNIFRFGGSLNRSTLLDGNLKALHFRNLDSFYTSSNVSHINSSRKTIISSNDFLNLSSPNILLSAATNINLQGRLTLGNFKNNTALDSILTVNELGELKLIPKQKTVLYSAENGLTLDQNTFSFGGDLKRPTIINGNSNSLSFSNINNLLLNSSSTATISSAAELSLSSGSDILLNAGNSVSIDGSIKLNRYKNNSADDLLLTVDAVGNLKLVPKPAPLIPTPPVVYSAASGLSIENNSFSFGGALNKSTTLNGSLQSLKFTNLDSFIVDSRFMSLLNYTGNTNISSNDSLNLNSQDLVLTAANHVGINGNLKLGKYKNNETLDSVLTVDASGNVKLIAQVLPQLTDGIAYGADNGLSVVNGSMGLGGRLKRSTLVNGNNQSLRFTNIDTFFLGGRHVQFINGTKKTTISSYDSLNLKSFGSMSLSANHVTVDGKFRLTGYKNSADMDSILTVDTCGALKLVSQKSLQTIAQNAFMNNGNSFNTAAYLGTNDKNALHFKTNNIVRGSIDTAGTLDYNYGVNINNSKLKVSRDIEINGEQPYAVAGGEKATYGLNFTAGNESGTRGTISINKITGSMNYTANGVISFYSALGGVPQETSVPDMVINQGLIRFGGRKSRRQPDEPTAAYHFKNYFDDYGLPKGIMFPSVFNHERAVFESKGVTPAIGLMFFNKSTQNLEIYKSDGWHRFLTQNVNAPVASTSISPTSASISIEKETGNSNSFVQALGDGQQKSFKISHNLNAQYVMVQFIDCGPEANCNLLQILPKGARVELDGKNNAVVTFDEAPSFSRYKIMFLRVQ